MTKIYSATAPVFPVPSCNDLVLVTNVIYTSSNPLSYTATRSIYSPADRFEQLKRTVSSVREKIPGAVVVLLEGSEFKTAAEKEYVENSFDLVVYFSDDAAARKLINGPYKGAAETYKLKTFLERMHGCAPKLIHKISGRYWLDDRFDYNFSSDKYNFLLINDVLATVYYVAPGALLGDFLKKLDRVLFWSRLGGNLGSGRSVLSRYLLSRLNHNSEWWYRRFFPDSLINSLPRLGISGHGSVDGHLFEM